MACLAQEDMQLQAIPYAIKLSSCFCGVTWKEMDSDATQAPLITTVRLQHEMQSKVYWEHLALLNIR